MDLTVFPPRIYISQRPRGASISGNQQRCHDGQLVSKTVIVLASLNDEQIDFKKLSLHKLYKSLQTVDGTFAVSAPQLLLESSSYF